MCSGKTPAFYLFNVMCCKLQSANKNCLVLQKVKVGHIVFFIFFYYFIRFYFLIVFSVSVCLSAVVAALVAHKDIYY